MAVPSTIADLSTTAASNSPSGSDSIGTSLDDFLRAIQSIVKNENAKGSDIASSTTITVPNNGRYFVVTGTTTINAINDCWDGRTVFLKFSGALTLTHSSGLILLGAANITTAAGDCAVFTNESTGVWRCLAYQKADGTAVSGGVSVSGNNTWTGTQTFRDNKFAITDDSDTSKVLNLQLSGITTATTRTLTVPDANITIAGTNTAQTFTVSQRATVTTDNDLSFDLSATNNFSCTPGAGGTLTFTNHTAGQSGFIKLVNGSNYAIAAAATTKISTADLTKISATGTYIISYFDDGTNAYCVASASLA